MEAQYFDTLFEFEKKIEVGEMVRSGMGAFGELRKKKEWHYGVFVVIEAVALKKI